MTEPAANLSSSFARLAVEYWRLLRAYDRLRDNVGDDLGARAAAQSRYALTRLESVLTEAGMRVAVFDGQPFHPGLPVRVLNGDEFTTEDELIVAFTNEPTILAQERVVALGAVTVDRRLEGEA